MELAKKDLSAVKSDLLKEKTESATKIEQVKQDVGAIRNQQTAYEQSNTQNLARITGQLGDKASKSEVKQEAGKIREEISQISVGGRNYIRHYDFAGLLPFSVAGSEWTFERVQDPTAKSGWALKATNVKGNDGGIHKPLVDLRGEEWQGKQMVWSVDVKSNRTDIKLYNIGFEAGGNITNGVRLSDEWQRVSKAFIVKFDTYWSFVVYGYGWRSGDVIWIRDPQLEDGNIATTPKPALEDTDEQITAARATFEKTAEGLKTDMTAVKSYVASDSQRREQLEQYTRTETARSTEALRKQVSESYVAKSQYTEDVRGITRRFEELNIGSPNLVLNGAVELGDRYWGGTAGKWFTNRTHVFYKNSKETMFVIDTNEPNTAYLQNMIFNKLKKNTTYTLSFTGFMSSNVSGFRALVGLLSDTDDAWKDAIAVFHQRLSSLEAERFTVTFNSGNYDGFSLRFDNSGSSDGKSATVWISEIDVYEGTMKRAYQPAPENNQNYADTKLAEYKQTIDGQLAAVKQDVNGKVSQTTFDQRANQITQTVQELNDNVVKKNQIRVNENGIVSTAEKVVNGQALASMISQNPAWVEIIAKLLKVKADMIVNGAITADKLNIQELSALSAKLGKVKSGEIINEYRTSGTYGEIKIGENIKITNHNTSGVRSHIPKEEIMMVPNGFLMNAYDAADRLTYTMRISPEVIEFQKVNYTQAQGGTGSWSLGYSNSYSLLSIDAILQKVRLQATSSLMWGIGATFVRIGNLVTISVTRVIKNIASVVENARASERIPDGFKPISQVHLTLTGNFNTTIDATCIVHLEPDGTINYTNNRSGNRVWTGTVTYTTVDDFPIVGNVPNGKLI
ncbi:hypothetical protein SCODD09_00712 [Streptococcus constellatus]|nr:hypothetical protein SCODD09_00712 [Streptococcus constellatus]